MDLHRVCFIIESYHPVLRLINLSISECNSFLPWRTQQDFAMQPTRLAFVPLGFLKLVTRCQRLWSPMACHRNRILSTGKRTPKVVVDDGPTSSYIPTTRVWLSLLSWPLLEGLFSSSRPRSDVSLLVFLVPGQSNPIVGERCTACYKSRVSCEVGDGVVPLLSTTHFLFSNQTTRTNNCPCVWMVVVSVPKPISNCQSLLISGEDWKLHSFRSAWLVLKCGWMRVHRQ